MMRALALVLLLWPSAAGAQSLLQCLSWVHGEGYPSGVEQGRCEARWDIPSPFTLECIGEITTGIEAEACRLHLADVVADRYRDYLSEEELEFEKQATGFGQ